LRDQGLLLRTVRSEKRRGEITLPYMYPYAYGVRRPAVALLQEDRRISGTGISDGRPSHSKVVRLVVYNFQNESVSSHL